MATDILTAATPCTKCGGSDISAKGRCRSCARIGEAEYRKENADKRKEASAKYRLENRAKVLAADRARRERDRDKLRVRAAERYAKNPEKYKAINRDWSKRNPDAERTKDRNRKARVRMAQGKITTSRVADLMVLQKRSCAACEASIKCSYHIDHITALSRGGQNEDMNIQLLCPTCNLRKHAKDPIEFMREFGKLL